eukprot:m.163580 g.163580  ORF g.163580 m.163580 type:complete len:95 (+) comp13416_c1_seq1:390-674(+)
MQQNNICMCMDTFVALLFISSTPNTLTWPVVKTTAMVRMPFEVIKQRRQSIGHAAWGEHFTSFKAFRGLWQGYTTLVAREVSVMTVQTVANGSG